MPQDPRAPQFLPQDVGQQPSQLPLPEPPLPQGPKPNPVQIPLSAPQYLPGDWTTMDAQQQQELLNNPEAMKNALYVPPGASGEDLKRGAIRAIPYITGGIAGIATEGAADLPWWLSALVTRPLSVGGGAAIGGGMQQGLYTALDMPEKARNLQEFWSRISETTRENALNELVGRVALSPLELVLAQYVFHPDRAMRWYASALGTSLPENYTELEPSVRGGLRQRILVTGRPKVMEKAKRLASKFFNEAEATIAASPVDIPPGDYVRNIERRLDAMRATRRNLPGNDEVRMIDYLEKSFLLKNANVRPYNQWTIDPQTGQWVNVVVQPSMKWPLARLRARASPLNTVPANQLKQDIYDLVRRAKPSGGANITIPGWTPGTHPGTAMEAYQEMARAIREELEIRYPTLKNLNRNGGEMVRLEDTLNGFVGSTMKSKINPLGRFAIRSGAGMAVGTAVGMAGASYHGNDSRLGGALGALSGAIVTAAIDNPTVKSALSMALNAASRPSFTRGIGGGVTRLANPGGLFGMFGTGPEDVPPGYFFKGPVPQHEEPEKTTSDEAPRTPVSKMIPPPVERSTITPFSTPKPPPGLDKPDQEVLHQEALQNINYAPKWPDDWKRMMTDVSARQGTPLGLLHVVANQEKNPGDPYQMSRDGAIGPMQIKPTTAREFGYTADQLADPATNIKVAALYLNQLMKMPELKNRPHLILAAYSAGIGNLRAVNYDWTKLAPEKVRYVNDGMALLSKIGLPPGMRNIVTPGAETEPEGSVLQSRRGAPSKRGVEQYRDRRRRY